MRKLALPTVLAVTTAALVATSAFGSFNPHFDLYSRTVNHRNVNGGTAFNEKLVDPAHPVNKVGYDRGFCKPISDTSARCRTIFFLDGEIGGRGSIRANGVVGANDARLNVTGGSGDFQGAAGKLLLGELIDGKYGPLHFDLVR